MFVSANNIAPRLEQNGVGVQPKAAKLVTIAVPLMMIVFGELEDCDGVGDGAGYEQSLAEPEANEPMPYHHWTLYVVGMDRIHHVLITRAQCGLERVEDGGGKRVQWMRSPRWTVLLSSAALSSVSFGTKP